MPEYVRVKDKSSGEHLSIIAPEVLDADAYQLLKQDAVNGNGDPLPAEFPTESAPPSATATTKEK